MNQIIFKELLAATERGEPAVLALISRVKGSSPQKPGAKAIFYPDGRIDGTLGGGCLEAEIQHRALDALLTRQPSAFELVLDHDFGWDDGLICGGKVVGLILPEALEQGRSLWPRLAAREQTLAWGVREDFSITDATAAGEPLRYEETVYPPCALWIAGAGHIAQGVAPLGVQLDFSVTVFDDRPALANPRFFPMPIRIVADLWDKMLAAPLPDRPAFGLIVTRGHRHDAVVLRHWIQKPFAFLGMIGSRRKSRIIFEHFQEEKIATAGQLEKVVCPVGLDIEAQTVSEIAVSIAAQLVQRRAEVLRPAGDQRPP